MKKYSFLLLFFLISQISFSQKVMRLMTKDVCKCIEQANKNNDTRNYEEIIEECVNKNIIVHYDDFINEFGEEYFDDENSEIAVQFGTELGNELGKSCDAFIDFIAKYKKEYENHDEFFNTARKQVDDGLYDEAIKNYNKAISLNNTIDKYYNYRGLAYYYKEQYYRAISDFFRAIEINPEYYIAYHNISKSKYNLGDYRSALEDINKSLSIEEYCESFNLKGLIFFSLEELDSANIEFRKAYNCDTTPSNYSYNIGYSYYQMSDYEEAIPWLEKAYSIDSSDMDILLYLGNCYNNIDKHEKAVETHTNYLRRSDSSYYVPFYNRGLAYYNMKEFNKSLSDYQNAFKLDSTDTDIMYYLAIINDSLDNNETAKLYYDTMISSEPDNPNLYDYRASFYMKVKNYDLAIEDYKFSIQLYPNDCKIHKLLGDAYLSKGEDKLANKSYKKAKELGCEDSRITSNLNN